MNNYNKVTLPLLAVALLMLAGCAGYKARPLNRALIPTSGDIQEGSVALTYRIFTKRDCAKYLDRDVIAKGYQPVHVTLQNRSNHRYSLCLGNFSFPCADAQEVAHQVHTSTAKRAASYGIGALFLWPLIIPAVVDGVGSSQANQQLDADFDQKALKDQILEPYTTINGLVFIPVEDFTPHFSLSLVNVTDQARLALSTTHSTSMVA